MSRLTEIQKKLFSQHELCNAAHEELKEEDMKFSMAQIEFLCAYITYMMQPYLDADELQKLHHNAKDLDSSCHASVYPGKSPKQSSDKGRFETFRL